jgi:hypothetical protein
MKYIILSLLALLLVVPITATYASTGMSNCTLDPDREDCNEQPDRVGNDGGGDSTDADRDGPGGDDGPRQTDDDDTGEANCWGQVTKSLTQNDDDQPGIGEHTSDPFTGDDDNETPRSIQIEMKDQLNDQRFWIEGIEGVGNQQEGHPSDHADQVGGLADDVPDCVD